MASWSHTCAIANSQVYCWGYNGSGQLGDGTTTQRLTPVPITGLSHATAVSVGADHTCVIDSGALKCWGFNGGGPGSGIYNSTDGGRTWKKASGSGLPHGTMGRVALPEMKRFKYDDALATGTVASGGTLGFIFPPSAGMVIYAVLTEQALGRLFLAGVIPGIILTLFFLIVIRIITGRRLEAGPPGPRATTSERVATLKQASGIIIIIVMTIGGMYAGLFTPIEASGFGAGFTMVLALLRRRLNWPVLRAVVLQTMRTSATIFLILMGAYVFIPFMTLSQLPEILVKFLLSFDFNTTVVLIIIITMYLLLGTFMEDFSMLILTLPVVMPVLKTLGVDLIWFGVIAVLIIQMGILSPPVGLAVFIVKGIVPDVPMYTIFRGIWPFWYAMGALIILLLIFPQLALFLPNTMFGN